MERIKRAFKKFVTWVKERRWWITITSVLTMIIVAQEAAMKSEHRWNVDLLNKSLSVTKDPDSYIEGEMQKLSDLVADELENSIIGDGIPKEDVDSICWGLRNSWHNFIYD